MAISAPAMPPSSMSSLRSPKWPMRNSLPATWQAGPERQVVARKGARDDLRPIDALRQHDGGHGIRVPLRRGRAQLELPPLEDGGTHAGGEVAVAMKHVLQPFLSEHGQR